MSADQKFVREGDKFAGGILTKQGAAEVNGHRVRVLNGESTITEKVLKTYYRAGKEAKDAAKVKEILDKTPW